MKKDRIFAYSMVYDDFHAKVFTNLVDAVKFLIKKKYLPYYALACPPLRAHYRNGSVKRVDLSDFVTEIEISPEKKRQIEKDFAGVQGENYISIEDKIKVETLKWKAIK